MRPRILLLVLLAALLGAAALLLQGAGRDEGSPAAAGGGAARAEAAPALGAAHGPGDELTRTKVQTPAAGHASSGGGVARGGPQQPVHLRVALVREDGQGDRLPLERAQGWTVRAQSWIAETREVISHEAVADRRGVAEFVFPGFVHVDWIACQPPLASGLAFSIEEPHVDVDGGETVEMELLVAAGAPLAGRVVDLDDRPVAGAVVHVFNPGWTYGVADWTPGFLHCASDAEGAFLFPPLAAGEWIVAVEPGAWLQVEPALENQVPGANHFSLAAGTIPTDALLRVIAAGSLAVQVEDAAGAPAAGVQLWAEPLELQGLEVSDGGGGWSGSPIFLNRATVSNWVFSSSLERSSMRLNLRFFGGGGGDYQAFLDGEDPQAPPQPEPDAGAEPEAPSGHSWSYGSLSAVTDEQGRAVFALPHGRWRITVALGLADGLAEPPPPQETVAPGPPLRFVLPFAMRPFRGRAVDARGMPVAYASAALRHPEIGHSLEVGADQDGRFLFAHLPALGRWILELRPASTDLVPCAWEIEPAASAERDYALPDGADLRILLRTRAGLPSEQQNANLRLKATDLEAATPDDGGRPSWGDEVGVVDLGGGADFHRQGLPPGNYEAELRGWAWTGAWNASGQPEYEERLWRSWSVTTRAEPWVLEWEPVPAEPGPEEYCNLAGTVVDERGDPVAGAIIFARAQGQIAGSAASDQNGAYFLQFGPMACAIAAHAPGFLALALPEEGFARGTAQRDLRLTRGGGSVTVRLRDRDGRRLPACEVRFLDGSGRPLLLQCQQPHDSLGPVAASGWLADELLELADVPPGLLVLEAVFWDAASARASIAVAAGENGLRDARLDLSLDELRDRLREAKPDPAASAVREALVEVLEGLENGR